MALTAFTARSSRLSRVTLFRLLVSVLMQETEKAEHLINDVVALTDRPDFDDNYLAAGVKLLNANIAIDRQSFCEAEQYAENALLLAEQDLTCCEDDINEIKMEYAEILQECGQLEKAEKQFMRVLNSVRDDEQNSGILLQILCRLAEIKAEQGESEQASFFAERAWEHLSDVHTNKDELALHYMSAFVAKRDGDLSRYAAELGAARCLLERFPGNRKLAGKISLL